MTTRPNEVTALGTAMSLLSYAGCRRSGASEFARYVSCATSGWEHAGTQSPCVAYLSELMEVFSVPA